jgi:hypothetical protein
MASGMGFVISVPARGWSVGVIGGSAARTVVLMPPMAVINTVATIRSCLMISAFSLGQFTKGSLIRPCEYNGSLYFRVFPEEGLLRTKFAVSAPAIIDYKFFRDPIVPPRLASFCLLRIVK